MREMVKQRLDEVVAAIDHAERFLRDAIEERDRTQAYLDALENPLDLDFPPRAKHRSDGCVGSAAIHGVSEEKSLSELLSEFGTYNRELLGRCRGHYNGCVIFATENTGLLRLYEASKALKDVGLSKAKRLGSISGTLHTTLSKSKDWTQVAPAIWIYHPAASQRVLEELRLLNGALLPAARPTQQELADRKAREGGGSVDLRDLEEPIKAMGLNNAATMEGLLRGLHRRLLKEEGGTKWVSTGKYTLSLREFLETEVHGDNDSDKDCVTVGRSSEEYDPVARLIAGSVQEAC